MTKCYVEYIYYDQYGNVLYRRKIEVPCPPGHLDPTDPGPQPIAVIDPG